jgi:hypothetical protein
VTCRMEPILSASASGFNPSSKLPIMVRCQNERTLVNAGSTWGLVARRSQRRDANCVASQPKFSANSDRSLRTLLQDAQAGPRPFLGLSSKVAFYNRVAAERCWLAISPPALRRRLAGTRISPHTPWSLLVNLIPPALRRRLIATATLDLDRSLLIGIGLGPYTYNLLSPEVG